MPGEDEPDRDIHPPEPDTSPAAREGLFAPPFLHHGPGIADSTTSAILPPALTTETTTRQSVSLGLFSSLWGNSIETADYLSNVPSIRTTSTAVDTPSSELSRTLTGTTLPATQSAALRALNAPAFHHSSSSTSRSRPAKSTSSRTSLSSQPVVVRTYSGSRHGSRPSSRLNSPRRLPNMNGSTAPQHQGLGAARSERLPAVEDFSFSNILRAVDPEIREAIDAIAEICARSRLSLADEYDAHLPPQGEIVNSGMAAAGWGASTLVGRGRLGRVAGGWAAENTLTAVPEASSSSERLAGESRGSVVSSRSGRGKTQSAYGSLKSVMSGEQKRKKSDPGPSTSTADDGGKPQTMRASSTPFLTLLSTPTTSNQLSYDFSSSHSKEPTFHQHRRHTSLTSLPPSHARHRSGTLSSLSSWMPWAPSRATTERPSTALGSTKAGTSSTKAETKLREVLTGGH